MIGHVPHLPFFCVLTLYHYIVITRKGQKGNKKISAVPYARLQICGRRKRVILMLPSPIDWRYFDQKRFERLKAVMRYSAESVPIGHNFFGQIRLGDLNYNINPGHLAKPGMGREEDTLCFLAMAYAPHNAVSTIPPTMEILTGKPIDYVPEADFIIPKEQYARMDYKTFQCYVENLLENLRYVPEVQEAIRQQTNFWALHDHYDHASARLLPEVRVVPSREHALLH